jgi:hypothetical protein
VTPGPANACKPGTPPGWLAAARATFGPPSGTYQVAGFTILVWPKNLLRDLAARPPHGPIQC